MKDKVAALGYPLETQYWNCCKPPNKGYAGTAILVSKEFGGEAPIKVTYDIPNAVNREHNTEGRVVAAEFAEFILVATYVPNAGVDGLKRLKYRVDSWDQEF